MPSNLYAARGDDRWIALTCGPVRNNRDLLLDKHLRSRGFHEKAAPMGERLIMGPYCDQLKLSADNVRQMLFRARRCCANAMTHDWADCKGRRALHEHADLTQHKG